MTEPLKPPYMPTLDEAMRFIQSNPGVSASILTETWRVARDDDRCSNGRLREIWKQAGGAAVLRFPMSRSRATRTAPTANAAT